MATYTYSGLHPREGTIPVHTFYSSDGSKPVVAMKSSIVIDGLSLQKTLLQEVTFMLNAFQHFQINEIYSTNQEYDYALLVENLDNGSIPDRVVHRASEPEASYMGIIINHNPRDNTCMVGCGPRVFTKVFSNFSCMDPSQEFPSVSIQTDKSSVSHGIYDCKADITCMRDCVSQSLSPASSCSNLHDAEESAQPTAAMSLVHNTTASMETPAWRQIHRRTEYLRECYPSAGATYLPRDEPQGRNTASALPLNPSLSDPVEENQSLTEAGNNASTPMSPEDFDAFKPTIPTYEKQNQTLYEDLYTVTI